MSDACNEQKTPEKNENQKVACVACKKEYSPTSHGDYKRCPHCQTVQPN